MPPKSVHPLRVGVRKAVQSAIRPGSYHLFMPATPVHSTVLGFEDARRVVEEQAALIQGSIVAGMGTESVDLLGAAGRVLAETVAADRDLPPFPRTTGGG